MDVHMVLQCLLNDLAPQCRDKNQQMCDCSHGRLNAVII